jgi:hypothetical protein
MMDEMPRTVKLPKLVFQSFLGSDSNFPELAADLSRWEPASWFRKAESESIDGCTMHIYSYVRLRLRFIRTKT